MYRTFCSQKHSKNDFFLWLLTSLFDVWSEKKCFSKSSCKNKLSDFCSWNVYLSAFLIIGYVLQISCFWGGDLGQEHTRTTTKNSRISRLSNNSSLLSHYTNQLISRHEPWSEVTLHFLCSFAPPHLCLPGEARLKYQPQVMRFRAETGKRRAKLKPPRGPRMGGSSNLVYPEVPLQQNRSKTSVHFPGEWGWSWPEGVVRWQTDWKPKSHERVSSPQEQS